mmetsp:Transcript_22782/g.66517  ORF Transcript_22782/g.66517 Transcript_22782/m.66517 type:complete len:290 (+) Transcript_22782:171-1040(+)
MISVSSPRDRALPATPSARGRERLGQVADIGDRHVRRAECGLGLLAPRLTLLLAHGGEPVGARRRIVGRRGGLPLGAALARQPHRPGTEPLGRSHVIDQVVAHVAPARGRGPLDAGPAQRRQEGRRRRLALRVDAAVLRRDAKVEARCERGHREWVAAPVCDGGEHRRWVVAANRGDSLGRAFEEEPPGGGVPLRQPHLEEALRLRSPAAARVALQQEALDCDDPRLAVRRLWAAGRARILQTRLQVIFIRAEGRGEFGVRRPNHGSGRPQCVVEIEGYEPQRGERASR